MATERSVKFRLEANPSGFIAGFKAAQGAVNDLRKDIDTTNDRTAWLAQSFLALAPALGPLSAAAVPALSGLATQMTIAGLAAGTVTLAFNGVGDALKALNDYQIDPTDAHLKKLHQTMALIGPTGRDLVRDLDQMRNSFLGLANLSRDKMFPGVVDGLHELADLFPRVQQIVAKTASTLGDLASEAGAGLGGSKFADFFRFLEAEAVPTLRAMGRTIGNLVDGFAAMLVAFRPLSRDFTDGLLGMSRAFAKWAHGLEDNKSFQDFIDYVRQSTPRVMDLLGQLAGTFVDIVKAAAPVGEVMIPLLTEILNVIQAIVDTPLGPIFIAAAAAMSVYGRAVALASITTGGLFGKALRAATGYDKLRDSLKLTEVEMAEAKVSTAQLAESMSAAAIYADVLGTKTKASTLMLGDAMSAASIKAAFLGTTIEGSTLRADKAISATSTKAIILGDDLAAIALKDSVPASIKAQIMFESSLGKSTVAAERLATELAVVNTQAERLTFAGKPVTAFQKDLTAVEKPAERGARSLGKFGGALAGSAAQIGIFGLALSPLPEKLHLTNTAMGAMLGSFGGPVGTAIGAAAGAVVDFSSVLIKGMTAIENYQGDADGLAATLDQQTGAITKNTEAYVKNQFAQTGVIQAARDIGISSDLIVQAYLGNELAIYRVQTALDSYKSSSEDSAVEIDNQRQALELLSSVLGTGTGDLADAREGLILTGAEVDTTTRKFKKATAEVNEFADAVTDLDAKLDQRANLRSYEAAIDSLAKSIRKDKKPGFDLDPESAKGREHQEQLDAFAGAIKDYADSLPMAQQEAFLDDAEKGFDRLAKKMGIVKDGPLKALKDRLGLLDLFEAKPGVRVKGTDKAKGEIDHIAQIMDHLDGKVVNPKIIIEEFFHARDSGLKYGSGPGFAAGGWTGNLPVNQKAGDVHGREYVVRDPYASMFRSELEARFPAKGYQGGGYVEPARAVPFQVSGPGFDYEQMGDAVARATAGSGSPFIGHATFTARGDVERQERKARRMQGAGGRSSGR